MKTIILASGSPRRKEILERVGLKFKIVESNFDEKIDPELKLKPHDLVKKFSLEKAKAVAKNHKNSIIIGADTIVFIDKQILGKPKDEKHAQQMLKLLSGRSHFVVTGFTIINTTSNKTVTKSIETKVWMKQLSTQEIDDYIATNEPFGKAGAYAIQEKGSVFIEKITGDFFNAVGLPIYALAQELRKLGVEILI